MQFVVVSAAVCYNMVSVGAWNSLECLLTESYPTEIRTLASGVLHSSGRLASFLAQLCDGFLIQNSVFLLLLVNGGVMLAGALSATALEERAGVSLDG